MGERLADDDLDGVLAELLRLPAEQRRRRLAEYGAADEVLARLIQGAQAWTMRDLHRALEATELVAELAESLGGPGVRSSARWARGTALAYANDFTRALVELDASAAIAERAGDAAAAARAGLTSVHALARLGRLDEAARAGEAALAAFRELGEDEWAAKAEVNLGVTRRMLDDPERAMEHFDRARPALKSNPVALAQLDSNRADALLELNLFRQAEEAFASAREAFERAGSGRAAAIAEGNLADLLSRQGRLGEALRHFERARRRFETCSAPGDLARLEAEQAEAFARAGLLEEAGNGYRAALPQIERHGLALEAARARAGLGQVLVRLGRIEEAEGLLHEASNGFRRLGNTAGAARVALLHAELALARGRGADAAAMLRGALVHLRDRPADAAIARHHLAAVARDQERPAEAAALLDEAIAAARQYNLAPLLADLLHARAKLSSERGEALAGLRAAVDEIERVRGSLQADRLRAAFAGDRTSAYEDLVASLLAEPDAARVAEAFHTVEKAKGRALLDLAAGAVACSSALPAGDDGAEATMVQRVLRLRADLNALYSRLPAGGSTGGSGAAVRRWRRRVEECEEALRMIESRLASARGAGGLFATPAGVETIQALLAADTALIEYFATGGELIAFVLRRDRGVEHFRLAALDDVEEGVELLRFQLERALSYPGDEARNDPRLVADALRELHALHELIVRPLAPSLAGARRLVVVPHGVLHAVPFQALYDGDRHLIEAHEVVHAPSASLLAHLDRIPAARAASTSVICGVADETAPDIEREVRAAAAILPDPSLYVGADATWDCLRAEAAGADVIHLACHGAFSADAPLASGLRLADRWITVRDVYELELHGAVVVLSGCETGRVAVGGGDELAGLSRGFFAAGASALLMSLWALHDVTAKNLLATIYESWQNAADSPSLATAVRAAQCRMLGEASHPLFWAAFILTGKP